MGLIQDSISITNNKRVAVFVLVAAMFLTSAQVQAAESLLDSPASSVPETATASQYDTVESGLRLIRTYAGRLRGAKDSPAVRSHRVTVTAYSSVPWQCDDTPFITADGSRVRDGIVAANFLKFGTRIRIPELFGDKVFEVRDRMNRRYSNRVDIWMERVSDGRKFGIKRDILIEVL